MFIKTEKISPKKKIKKNFISLFLKTYFFLTLFIGLLISYYIVTSYQFEKQVDKLITSVTKTGRFEMIYLPVILLKSLQSNFYKIDRINMSLSFENELILEDYRKKIINKGELKSFQAPRVNVEIQFQEKNFSGRVRLKGDRKTHWENRKDSSYKFELDDDVFFMGMNKFSIHKPIMRNYIHEWLFHEMTKELGLIGLNYKFIKTSINGTDRGLYVLEEGFGKELIERSERRNGPIFSMVEDLSTNTFGNWYQDNTNLEIYNKKYWNKKENYELLKTASNKLNNFFLGNEKFEDVFDVEKWASYLALCDLFYTYHGAYVKSVRYYYNPITGKIEPIAFDGHRGRNHPNYNRFNKDYNNQIILDYLYNHNDNFFQDEGLGWLNLFFLNKDKKLNENFYKLYIEKLELVTSDNFLNIFLDSRKQKIKEINSHIYSDYFLFDNLKTRGPGFYYHSKKDLKHRVQTIREKIRTENNNYPDYIQAGIENNNLIIKNYSRQDYASIIVTDLICEFSNNYSLKKLNSIEKFPLVNFHFEKLKNDYKKIENKYVKTVINLEYLKIANFEKCNSINIENLVNKEKYTVNLDKINFNYSKKNKKILTNYLDFFKKNGDNLLLKENTISIDKNIYIPKGFLVVLKSGQKIILKNGAFIYSHSAWSANADEKKISITGDENNFGGGILISSKEKKSIFNNVSFSNLKGLDEKNKKELLVMGSLNFYETNVELTNIKFSNILSEDAINLFRSNFNIQNAKFSKIFSDGIDFDFSKGLGKNLFFENVGGDALDFSGSIVNLSDVNSEFIGDKVLSAGEMSIIEVINIKSSDSFSGIVSKDGSEVKIFNANMERVLYPFSAYLKKAVYDKPSFIKVYDTDLIDKKSNYLVDDISKIYLNDRSVGIFDKKVKNLLNKTYNVSMNN